MKFKEILNEERFQYEIDGYGYHEEEDFAEPDEPSKKWHYMTTPQGERITLNHSPYQWMERDEFADYVGKHKAKSVTEAIQRPELNIIHTRKELEQAYMQLISIVDAQEVIIEMQKEQEYEAFAYGIEQGDGMHYGIRGAVLNRDELPQIYKDWIANGRKAYEQKT